MGFWRFFGWILVLISIAILGMDALVSMEQGGFGISSLAQYWARFAPHSHESFFAGDPGLFKSILAFILRLPAFAPFLLLGLIAVFTHPQRRKGIFRR